MGEPARQLLLGILESAVEAYGEGEVRAALAEVSRRPKRLRSRRSQLSAAELAERARSAARQARGG